MAIQQPSFESFFGAYVDFAHTHTNPKEDTFYPTYTTTFPKACIVTKDGKILVLFKKQDFMFPERLPREVVQAGKVLDLENTGGMFKKIQFAYEISSGNFLFAAKETKEARDVGADSLRLEYEHLKTFQGEESFAQVHSFVHYRSKKGEQKQLLVEPYYGRDLCHVLQNTPPTEEQKSFIAAKLLFLVTQIGKKGLVHRDIKPDNILVSGENFFLTLCDFGSLCPFEAPHEKKDLGTPAFLSPEILTLLNPLFLLESFLQSDTSRSSLPQLLSQTRQMVSFVETNKTTLLKVKNEELAKFLHAVPSVQQNLDIIEETYRAATTPEAEEIAKKNTTQLQVWMKGYLGAFSEFLYASLSSVINPSQDAYALGITFVWLFYTDCFQNARNQFDKQKLATFARDAQKNFQAFAHNPLTWYDQVILQLIDPNPRTRLTAEQICQKPLEWFLIRNPSEQRALETMRSRYQQI